MKKLCAILLVMTLALGLFAGCDADKAPEEATRVIGVVAKGESHAFWKAVRAGAEAAGQKYGYTVTFQGPASESAGDLPSQMEMVQTALSNDVSGLVLATIGEGYTDLLTQAYDRGVPVVQFDSGIWAGDVKALDEAGKNPIVSSVATSNRDAAALAADYFFKEVREDIAASDRYVVGIIQHDRTQTGIDRAGGFTDRFTELADADTATAGRYVIETEVRDGDENDAYVTALEALCEKGARAVFLCNEGVVKQVSDAIAEADGRYDDMVFSGFDAGTKQIRWIRAEAGPRLIGSVVQDSYNIGFNAVEQCVFAIEGRDVNPSVSIAGAWYNTTNLDDMIAKNLVYEG